MILDTITNAERYASLHPSVSYTHLDVYKRQGLVKWFNDSKGFGFITPDAGGDDLFAHFSAIVDTGYKSLKENDRVSFDITEGPKGKQASNIQKV